MPIDVRATQDGIDRLIAALPASAAHVSSEMASEAQRATRANLTDPLGPLAESVLPEGPDQIGTFSYRTRLGPTLVYGRQRELGGSIEPVTQTYLTASNRAPGYWMWDYGHGRGLEEVFALNVFQEGQHYLKRGVEQSIPAFMSLARRVWGELMRIAE
jgi:hypothetical protein